MPNQLGKKPSLSLSLLAVVATLLFVFFTHTAHACTFDTEFPKNTVGADTYAIAQPGANSACTIVAPAEDIQLVDIWLCRGNVAVVPETDAMTTSTQICTDQTEGSCRDLEEFVSTAENDYINFQQKPWRWLKIINTVTAGTYRVHCLGAR